MTDDEIEKLAVQIVKQKGGFYVEPEDHYLQHQQLGTLLKIYNTTNITVLKFIIGALVLGVFALVGLGLGWHK